MEKTTNPPELATRAVAVAVEPLPPLVASVGVATVETSDDSTKNLP